MEGESWGERRERALRWRRWAVVGVIGVVAGATALVLPFASGGFTVFGPRVPVLAAPEWVRVAAGVTVMAVLFAGARYNWVISDEARRRSIATFWATIGFALCASFPLIHVVGPLLPEGDRLAFVYAFSLGVGCLGSLWRRLQGYPQ